MIWRGPWDGVWDGNWEGQETPLAPGFFTGTAPSTSGAIGSLTGAGFLSAVASSVSGSTGSVADGGSGTPIGVVAGTASSTSTATGFLGALASITGVAVSTSSARWTLAEETKRRSKSQFGFYAVQSVRAVAKPSRARVSAGVANAAGTVAIAIRTVARIEPIPVVSVSVGRASASAYAKSRPVEVACAMADARLSVCCATDGSVINVSVCTASAATGSSAAVEGLMATVTTPICGVRAVINPTDEEIITTLIALRRRRAA
jgi:hypothetical protein